MPRYRLYRCAVAGGTGLVGGTLSRQLVLSPLCSEVHAVGRAELRTLDGLAAAAKLRQLRCDLARPLCDVDASALKGVDAAFCTLGARGGWTDDADVAAVERDGAIRFAELCAAAGVPHFSLLSSAWADASSRLAFARHQGEAADAIAAMDAFRRVSIFRPGAVVDEEGRTFDQRLGPQAWSRALWRAAPTAAQFLPTRFRQVPLADVALAMRLNVELCDPSGRVEVLGFREMMQVIGREAEI
eukprot:TRINITY_DN64979_c0_g1_i1.p3 TRINITY_DN64979_c0_g1~~TRINITY_DN64979_c0_g1_i1.p3  ORF type:complete len:243 (+),score=57.29 TRINITY_DN64979_c0_g1_i1:70-798(+)